MLKDIRLEIATSVKAIFLLTVLLGLIYPVTITVLSQILFPWRANGSLIIRKGHLIGSALIGQPFDDPKYFWPRPSATSPYPYNAGSSGGSNLGPTNPALLDAVKGRVEALRKADMSHSGPVPVDLVTTSGSGLDPDVSPAAALYQVSRVARARGLDERQVNELVLRHIERPQLGVFGEPRVNVLMLNLELDGIQGELIDNEK